MADQSVSHSPLVCYPHWPQQCNQFPDQAPWCCPALQEDLTLDPASTLPQNAVLDFLRWFWEDHIRAHNPFAREFPELSPEQLKAQTKFGFLFQVVHERTFGTHMTTIEGFFFQRWCPGGSIVAPSAAVVKPTIRAEIVRKMAHSERERGYLVCEFCNTKTIITLWALKEEKPRNDGKPGDKKPDGEKPGADEKLEADDKPGNTGKLTGAEKHSGEEKPGGKEKRSSEKEAIDEEGDIKMEEV